MLADPKLSTQTSVGPAIIVQSGDDEVFAGQTAQEAPTKSDVTSGAVKDVSNRENTGGMQTGERKRNTDSSSSNDDDTPHLYRSRQSLQESYAAQHLRSMRGASVEPPSVTKSTERRFERDHLQNVSVSSIEVGRQRDMSVTDTSMHSKMAISPEDSLLDNSSFTKKRPFTLVDRSPLRSWNSTSSHTGMTMTFEAFAIGDEHRRKRSFLHHDNSASPTLRESRLRGLRSFKSRLSMSKSSKRSKRLASVGSSQYSSMGSSAKDSSVYMASVSSIGSDADLTGIGVQLGMLPSGQTPTMPKSTDLRARTQSTSSSSSEMDLSSPVRRCSSPKAEKAKNAVEFGEPKLILPSITIGSAAKSKKGLLADTPPARSSSSSMDTKSDRSESRQGPSDLPLPSSISDASLVSSPCSEVTGKSSLNSLDVELVINTSVDSDVFTGVLPATPDSDIASSGLGACVQSVSNPFKTPSPVRQPTFKTPPNYQSVLSPNTKYDLNTSNSSNGEDFCLKKLFSLDQSISSEPGDMDLDSSLNDLSLNEKNPDRVSTQSTSPQRPSSIGQESDKTKTDSPFSLVSSTTTTATLTPENTKMGSDPFEPAGSEKHSSWSSSGRPVPTEFPKPKNKLLKKVTTFMSLPASSGGSDCDHSDLSTPVARGQTRRRNFMVSVYMKFSSDLLV